MTENNLFQFAQVIAELPLHNSGQSEAHINQFGHRYLPVRKNACIVCSICFTCSKYYGVDCACQEVQPRRGKNLPEGGLDSRAKKLHPEDHDDYAFSIKWINENAHSIYKNEHDQVVGLRELAEVSLCKAHSSTLYRAKKRHERSKSQAPPSPADSNGLEDHSHPSYHKTSPFINPYPTHENTAAAAAASSGGLAAKVRELAYQPPPQPFRVHEAPDFTRMTHSNSGKRKRTTKQHSPEPLSSASTPLYTSSRSNQFTSPVQVQEQNSFHPMHSIQQQQQQPLPPPLPLPQSQPQPQVQAQAQAQQPHHSQQQQQQLQQPPSFSQSHIKQDQQQQQQQQQQQLQQAQSFSQAQIKSESQQFVDSYPSQLPPLQSKSHSYSTSASFSPLPLSLQTTHGYPTTRVLAGGSGNANSSSGTSGGIPGDPVPSLIAQPDYHQQQQQQQQQQQNHLVVETVSLRNIPSPDIPSMYYFRNLAITDSFKFRDLLAEIDIQGNPPPGKRIVISDASNEKIYPLDQPIQSAIKRPTSTHVELCLGLSDQPSINWSEYPTSSTSS